MNTALVILCTVVFLAVFGLIVHDLAKAHKQVRDIAAQSNARHRSGGIVRNGTAAELDTSLRAYNAFCAEHDSPRRTQELPVIVAPRYTMTAKAHGATREELLAVGWTDALLVAHGIMYETYTTPQIIRVAKSHGSSWGGKS